MNPQAQQKALAELDGWVDIQTVEDQYHDRFMGRPRESGSNELYDLPDYLNDLNAVRALIVKLPTTTQATKVGKTPLATQGALRAEVWRLSSQMTVLPPAIVFCEAILRACGKWEEDKR